MATRPPFTKYGLTWLPNTSPLAIEFEIISQTDEWRKQHGLNLFDHYKEAQTILWPNDDHHRWSDVGLRAIVENEITVFMGSSDSGKTRTMAKFVLMDWWARPDKCLWLISSTELRGAELRIWGVLKELFNSARERHRSLPGTVLESSHAITTEATSTDNSEGRLLTKGLVFVPCKKGGSWVGLGALIGVKPMPGGRLGHCGDETQSMEPVFLDSYSNWYGKPEFKGIMAGNPFDLDDTLCRAAEPVEGWDSWHDTGKTQTWRSKFYNAFVVSFDGRDSPNFDYSPDQPTRYKYLIGRKKIEAVGRTHGKDSWQWFMQCVGKPRPGAVARRVVTRAMCETYHAFTEVNWLGEPTTKIGFCDAAYGGMGGDRCIAGYIEFGKDVNGHVVIACHPFVLVPVKVNRFVLPEDQIANFVRDYMQSVNVPPENFFFDGRGSLAVAFSRLWSPKVEAVEFGGRATERPVSNDTFMWDGDRKTRRLQRCDELYSRFVTELWFAVHMVIISDQMRQLPQDVAAELCRREWDYVQNAKIEVETKEEMKLRTGESPDLADGLVTAIEGARRRGFQIARLPGKGEEEEDNAWKYDLRLQAQRLKRSYTLTHTN